MGSYLWERADQHQPALRQMLDCSRSFPGFRPEGRAYPNEMRRLFEEATLQLSQQQPTSLQVTSAGRNGCTVRVNGMDVGRSPVQLTEVRAGPTRLQLECEAGAIGRIHLVDLKPGENELAIDPGFDAAVHRRVACGSRTRATASATSARRATRKSSRKRSACARCCCSTSPAQSGRTSPCGPADPAQTRRSPVRATRRAAGTRRARRAAS